LISGASQATLVVEARAGSGSLITAQKAIAQGRSVYALLTTATATAAVGAQALLEEGAKPLLGVRQVLSDFIHIYPKALCLENADSKVAPDLPLLLRLGVIDAEDAIEKTEAKEEGKVRFQKRSTPPKGTSRESVREIRLTEEMLGAMSPAEAAIMRLFFKEEEIPSEQFYSLPYEANEISMALTCLEIAGRIKRTAGSLYRLSAERL
jgi:predicted Rossmann fold nucleotide-binding protein DprA/Smf involved in DNA uptake